MRYEDMKITVSQETGKKIAQIICKEIQASIGKDGAKGANSKIYDRARRCENQYNQITKWMAAGKTCPKPWLGAADYFIPITEWTIDAVHARVMNVLFSQEPFMTAKGADADSLKNQEAATDFMDMVFRNIIFIYDNINFYFKQVIKLPFAVIKYCWVKEFDSVITKQDAIHFVNPSTGEEKDILPDSPDFQVGATSLIANGWQQQETRPVWVTKDVELVNSPQLKYIRFDDYVWSPNAKRDSKLFWEGDRCWFTVNDLMLKANQDIFIKETVDKVKNQSGKDKSGIDRVISERASMIECFNWYGRLPFDKNNEINFEDTKAMEQEVCCVVAYKDEELLQTYHWPYSRLPYPDRVYIRGEFEETENFEGRSLSEKLYMTQKEMNSFINTIMNNAMLAMQKIFVRKKTALGDDKDKVEVYPGATVEEDNTGDIRVLEIGDVKAIGLEMEQLFINFAERTSNISIYQTGTARDEGGKTLGEVQATISEGNIGMDKFIQRCHNIMRKICDWTIDYYVDNMPENLQRKLTDPQGKAILPTQQNMPIYAQRNISPVWRPEDINGKYDWKWNGTSLTSSNRWKLAVANDMMERYLPHPMISGNMLATWEILRQGLIVRGQDWTTILPTKEAVINEMRRMAQESQAKQAAGQQQQLKKMVMGKMVGSGVPPQQAAQIVNEQLPGGNLIA
jgi:hypothetical protein